MCRQVPKVLPLGTVEARAEAHFGARRVRRLLPRKRRGPLSSRLRPETALFGNGPCQNHENICASHAASPTFYTRTFSTRKKHPFRPPPGRAPGPLLEPLRVQIVEQARLFANFFAFGPIFGPNGQSVKKCTFELSNVPPASAPGRRPRGPRSAKHRRPRSAPRDDASRRRFRRQNARAKIG